MMPLFGLVDVLDVDDVSPDGRDVLELADDALRAAKSLDGFLGTRRLHFGLGCPDVFAVFVAQLERARYDEWRWLVVGDLPRVALPLDVASHPRGALEVYCDGMDAWIRAKGAGRAKPAGWVTKSTIPRALLGGLRSRVDMLRRLVLTAAEPYDDLIEVAPLRPPIDAAMLRRFRPGDLVLDHRNEPGIVSGMAARPEAQWLAIQKDPRSRQHAVSRWWDVLPLSGGSIHVAEPILVPQGRPTEAQVREAHAAANDFGKWDLETLFPDMKL